MNMKIRDIIKTILTEDNRMRNVIRFIVRDIIKVFKENNFGEFHLPEYFEDRDEMVYKFTHFSEPFSVELIMEEGDDGYDLDANFYRDENVIEIKIIYNPDEKNSIMYELIGELNEIVAHELRHNYQRHTGSHNLDVEEPESPYEYYTQPHELDAQVFGFKRLSKLINKPFDYVVRNWFDTHKNIHRLSEDESEKVIEQILNYKK